MSLYGYGLAYFVVESSLDVPTGCAGKLRWQTAGMFGEAAMRNCGMVWVKLRWLEPTRHKRGLLGGCDAHAGGETSVGT
jgi:hypothetical protein